MIATVTFADDPILIQGPALAHNVFHAPNNLTGYFLSALGLGAVLGSLKLSRRPVTWKPSDTSRHAAWSLIFLFVFVVVFAAGFSKWISVLAAFAVGVTVLNTGAVAQAELSRQRRKHTASVMALWVIAWAGTKPLASLLDGWLASHFYLWLAAAVLAAPALIIALLELCLPPQAREAMKHLWYQRLAPRTSGPALLPDEATVS